MKRKIKSFVSASRPVLNIALNIYEVFEAEIRLSENEPWTAMPEDDKELPLVSVLVSPSLSKDDLIAALDRLKADLLADEIE